MFKTLNQPNQIQRLSKLNTSDLLNIFNGVIIAKLNSNFSLSFELSLALLSTFLTT